MKKCLFLLLILCLIPSLIYGAGINISALPDGGSTVDKASVMAGNIGSRTGTTSRFTIAELFGLYFGTLTSGKFCTYNGSSGKVDCASSGTSNLTADNTWTGSQIFNKVNAAGGSANALTLSGTLGIMDGSDTFRGIYLNYTNADHTGSSNNIYGILINDITGDSEADEVALKIGLGWDYGIHTYSPIVIYGNGSTTPGYLYLEDADNSNFLTISAPVDIDTSYNLYFPSAAPTEDNSVMAFATDGSVVWIDLDNYAASGDLASYVPLSTFTAAGDIPVGSGSGAVTHIGKGDPNTFFGVNNAGTLGFHASFNPVLVSAPTSDDTYSGTVASFVAGEALAQWDVVYCKNKAGVHACYKYDANGADKALPPRAMAVAAINADASGTFLLTGIVRNDGWSQTTNQDEGKIVYADGTTAGAITLTKSTTSADMIAIVGYVIEQNVVYFNPSPILVEVP